MLLGYKMLFLYTQCIGTCYFNIDARAIYKEQKNILLPFCKDLTIISDKDIILGNIARHMCRLSIVLVK